MRRVEEIARESGYKLSQLALAWVLSRGEDIEPIPGTKSRKYLEENVAALDLKLIPDDLLRINKVVPPGAAVGARYGAGGGLGLLSECDRLLHAGDRGLESLPPLPNKPQGSPKTGQ